MKSLPSFGHLSDADLTSELGRLVHAERGVTAHVVACIGEFDVRRLYLPQGFSSMFTYARDHLHLGDGAAYRRIEAARAARRFPDILPLIARGAITLTNLGLIAPHLTVSNHNELLAEIAHKRKSEVEIVVARLKPKPDVPSVVRKLPATTRSQALIAQPTEVLDQGARPAVATDVRTVPRPVIAPLTPERFRLQITMNQETHDRLRQLQNLMRHSIPSGDAALIVERALKLLLEEVLRRKCGALKRPRREKEGLLQIERRALG